MTSSFMKREFCAHKTNVMHMYVRSMDVACFCDYYPLANEVAKGYRVIKRTTILMVNEREKRQRLHDTKHMASISICLVLPD